MSPPSHHFHDTFRPTQPQRQHDRLQIAHAHQIAQAQALQSLQRAQRQQAIITHIPAANHLDMPQRIAHGTETLQRLVLQMSALSQHDPLNVLATVQMVEAHRQQANVLGNDRLHMERFGRAVSPCRRQLIVVVDERTGPLADTYGATIAENPFGTHPIRTELAQTIDVDAIEGVIHEIQERSDRGGHVIESHEADKLRKIPLSKCNTVFFVSLVVSNIHSI